MVVVHYYSSRLLPQEGGQLVYYYASVPGGPKLLSLWLDFFIKLKTGIGLWAIGPLRGHWAPWLLEARAIDSGALGPNFL